MDVRVVCVPVIDGHPVEPRAEVDLHLPGQVAAESSEVSHLAGILGRDDEAEMVSVILAPVRKGEIVRAIGAGVEHDALFSIPADALTLEIG